jgi:hypothetical protein
MAANDPQLSAMKKKLPTFTDLVMRSACRGPTVGDNLAGLPGNQPDQIRCASVSGILLYCQNLAFAAGEIDDAVSSGETTFADEQTKEDNPTAGNVSGALMVAEMAPPGKTPGQIARAAFNGCLEMTAGR